MCHNYSIKYTDDKFGTHIILYIYNGLQSLLLMCYCHPFQYLSPIRYLYMKHNANGPSI